MKDFFEHPWVGYSSLFVCLLVIIFSIVVSNRLKSLMALTGEQAKLFDKLGADSRMQVLLTIGLPILLVVAVTLMGNHQISVELATGYSASAILGGFAALWNIWKAYSSLKSAVDATTDETRHQRLKNVHDTMLRAFYWALMSIIGGVLLLIAYNVNPPVISPSWWVFSFLLTISTTRAIAFTVNGVAVAEKYETDPLYGRMPTRFIPD